MADAIVGATVQVLLEKALSLAIDRIGSVFGFKKDLESLRGSANMIQAILANDEDKKRQRTDVQLWLKKLEGVAFDAYYVLDELNYEILRRKVKSRNQLKEKVCLFFLSKDDISFRWRMASKVTNINIQLKTINQEATDFGLIRIPAPLLPATTGVTMNRQTDSVVAPNVVGRDGDESKIVNMLLTPSEKLVSVLPIVGMGGLGKTTLAKSVYNNQQVHGHFIQKIWVCVSEKFEVMELFKLILGSLTRSKVEMPSRDDVVQEIRKQLEGKRYLLVLDDVWNDVPELWYNFLDSLVGITTTSGSWCIVTTRDLKVASIASRHTSPYVLRELADYECWSIVKAKVIEGGEIPEELSQIRMQITKRCCGLPLAANVIGGLLCLQRKEDWLSIVEARFLNENSIQQTLMLSFDYLPSPSIKKCFAYCSLFEKDAKMERNLLIELWLAEGFLQPHLQNETMMEEAGDRYLNILLHSSLLEEERENFLQGTFYKMHDYVHDLAQLISKLEHINSDDDVIKNSYHQIRYLALPSSSGKITMLNDKSTLILERSNISEEMLLKFKHLHILNLSTANIRKLPISIGKLKHLRFLNLSRSGIKSLPESFCKLYNLQTLRMDNCYRLETLPKGMSNLISLRHLHYYNDDVKLKMPSEMGRLTSLQTLEFFNVGEEKGRQIEELGCLKDLKGKLKIRNLELVHDKEGAARANLYGKPNLLKLEYLWGNKYDDREDCTRDELVLEGLEPHPNLHELTIWNFMGDQFPRWLGNLPKLVRLELRRCKRCRELPVLGHLQYLKTLTLIEMSGLVEWKEAKAEAVDDIDVFPVLEDLTIEGCSQLTIAPTHFPSLKELKISGNMEVLVVKSIVGKVTNTLVSLTLRGMNELTHISDLVDLSEFKLLRELVISFCHGIVRVSGSSSNNNQLLKSLEHLEIVNCDGLMSIASETFECCTPLRWLWVCNGPNLESFPLDLRQTPSLSTISLKGCHKLFLANNNTNTPRGFEHLTSLRSLSIGPFSHDDDSSIELFDWSGLISLPRLVLYGLPETESLPDQLQHLTSLTSLELHGFGSIEALPDWLGNLASLQTLYLWRCEKLRYLPSMPALRRLTKLTHLSIYHCPLLKERCKKRESGPDESEWSVSSQLPHLRIFYMHEINGIIEAYG